MIPPRQLGSMDCSSALRARFGEGDNARFVGIDVCESPATAPGILLACGRSASPQVVDELARWARPRDCTPAPSGRPGSRAADFFRAVK